mmetsp:Transcript_3646/g.6211  ORF Transcript_3646/g.6211 Transcript_3646/m.6211 type:complete len:84 (-) Transcript_3646:816-1067(-)
MRVSNNIHNVPCLEEVEFLQEWNEEEKIPIKASPTPPPQPKAEEPKKEGEADNKEGEGEKAEEPKAEEPKAEEKVPEVKYETR